MSEEKKRWWWDFHTTPQLVEDFKKAKTTKDRRLILRQIIRQEASWNLKVADLRELIGKGWTGKP
jgi:hypothetical protein